MSEQQHSEANNNKLILIVEDDAILRMLVKKQLAQLGFASDAAADGIEALAKIRLAEYKLILMDIQMPELDGLEATLAVREFERSVNRRPAPIIAVTANPHRERCLNAGMDDFLFKPIMLHDLETMLNHWISG